MSQVSSILEAVYRPAGLMNRLPRYVALHAFLACAWHTMAMAEHAGWLPSETVAAFSIRNSSQWQDAWQGGLLNDESMKPYLDEIRQLNRDEFEKSWTVGLSIEEFDELYSSADGEITFAMMMRDESLEMLLLVDVVDQTRGDALLATIDSRLDGKSNKTSQRISGVDVITYSRSGSDKDTVTAFSFALSGRLFIAATSESEMRSVLDRRTRSQSGTENAPGKLSSRDEFEGTVLRARQETPEWMCWWYVRPLQLGKAIRDRDPDEPGGIDYLQVAEKEGADAIQGMGGVGEIGGAYQLLATVYVHAPGPFQRAMRMVKFPNQASFESQDWIRKNVSGFGALSPDYEKAFEAYPTLFDTLYGDGEEGVFETVFADIRDEPDGPRVDLKKEIVAQLTGSVSFAMLPLDDGSSDVAIQIRVRDEQRFADSIRKLFEGDEQAKAKRFPNHTVWEISPMEEDGQKNSRLETVAITVKDSHFVWASSPATLRRLTTDKDDSDGQAFHVNEIRDELKRRTGGSACLVSFADLETVYRQTYRQLHNSELSQPSATISNAIGMFDSFKRADPHKLPDFETIRHYLTGAFGMAAVTTPRGWRIVIVVQ